MSLELMDVPNWIDRAAKMLYGDTSPEAKHEVTRKLLNCSTVMLTIGVVGPLFLGFAFSVYVGALGLCLRALVTTVDVASSALPLDGKIVTVFGRIAWVPPAKNFHLP